METSDVKRQVLAVIERARQQASGRRARVDDATRAYSAWLNHVAIPLFRQVAGVLRAENRPFTVDTPAGGARLVSERGNDYVALRLDTEGVEPFVVLETNRTWGGRVINEERGIGEPSSLDDATLLDAVIGALEPFVAR